MIKMFASDLDGTLLTRSHQFDELIKLTIEKIVSKGIKATICTGRDCAMTKLNGLEKKIYKIYTNGALIMSPENDILKLDLIDKKILNKLLIEFNDLNLEFISPYNTYTKKTKAFFIESFKQRLHLVQDDKISQTFLEEISKKILFDQTDIDIQNKDICKINVHLLDGICYDRLYKFINDNTAYIVNAPSNPDLIEITKQGANKGSALKWLAHYLNIVEDDVAVYGDGGNDIEMLSFFKNSYAPTTASDKAKQVAKNILGPCFEYSVARNMLEQVANM